MDENEEKAWGLGYRAAFQRMLGESIRELGYENVPREALAAEREGAIRALRTVCAEHGDNDWTPDLHLADIIEKHLGRHLERRNC